jgi:hypothetical protein
MVGDIKNLMAAIRPVLIMNSTQAATAAILAQAPLPIVSAPYLAADQIIAVDAAAFASSLGPPDFNVSDDPTVHMSDAPLPIGTADSPATVAAPTQSLWQTACVGMKTLIDADWLLRRSGAVATITGTTW